LFDQVSSDWSGLQPNSLRTHTLSFPLNGYSKTGKIPGSEFLLYHDMDWNLRLTGDGNDKGGHDVGLGDYILKKYSSGEPGFVAPRQDYFEYNNIILLPEVEIE
jgi:hypothetical protein